MHDLYWVRTRAGFDFQEGHLGTLAFLRYIQKEKSRVNNVLDIGAHTGYWTRLCKSVFPNATVHAFEPFDAHRDQFLEYTRKLKGVWLHGVALDAVRGDGELFLTSATDSSSLLRASSKISDEYGIREISVVSIKKETLDHMISSGRVPQPDLIKIDTQGTENRVFAGARKILKSVRYVICEVSLRQFYETQPLFHHVDEYLQSQGFELTGINPWQILPLPPQFDGLWKNTTLE